MQRQDVEPTEEAEAIAYLSEKYAPTEIAKRLGRTDNFIRQRLKLAGLIDGFKQFVRNGEMTISLGVGVALFEPEEQQMMLETMGEDFNAHQINRMIKDQTYDLEKAAFDVTDKKLVRKLGLVLNVRSMQPIKAICLAKVKWSVQKQPVLKLRKVNRS